ncbi:MAG: VWA domain-containing protein [Actinobacteria bacterium]|uniref:Unannotated protein n=1 Tax=freshwater metagenome TaxID=449393 RepID=A0A6J6SCY7_9ZZZZ|nr:VWA domain-containing protein [Actinomycetota bacterium]
MSLRHALLRTVAAAALATGVVLGSASAGLAADGSIAHVETTDDGVQILVSVPVGSDVDLDGVSVTIADQSVEATAVPASSSDAVRRTAILAIDTSNSMSGDRIDAARQAALTFLDSVPADVYIGVVSFAGDVRTEQVPTLDRDSVRAVVEGLTLSRDTRLYDGILSAIDLAGSDGQRKLVVLSDGADTSDTPVSSVIDRIKASGVLVDVIALESGEQNGALDRLAAAGDGDVIAADSAALGETFAAEADALDRQVLVTAAVPDDLISTDATVRVTLPDPGGAIVAQAFTTVTDTVAGGSNVDDQVVVDDGWAAPDWVMYVGVGALAVGLVVLLMSLVPRAAAPMSPADRVATYTAGTTGRSEAAGARIDADQALTQAKDAAANVLRRNKGLEVRIAARLDGSGSDLKPAEWLLIHAGVFLLSGLVGLLAGAGSLPVGLLFLVLGAVGPWLYLGLRRSRRRKKFNSLLPDTLQLMSGALSAGLSLAQSVDTIVKEGAEPVSSEFRRVLVETRLGVSVEEALEGVAERFESKDFAWVVMAIKIQRQVGGNLAELLDTVAATMREREYMRRQVASLSAEGRLSAYVLGGLPPLFLIYLTLTQGDYVAPLFDDVRGLVMLIGAGVWLSIGAFWMSRLVKVEV